jgi:glutathione S-transferase
MASIKLLGLRISVYTRIARLALEEKKVDYELQEVDIFADTGPPAEYLECNPFGTIPCLRYGNFSLYETGAICRYVDEMFLGIPPYSTATLTGRWCGMFMSSVSWFREAAARPMKR